MASLEDHYAGTRSVDELSDVSSGSTVLIQQEDRGESCDGKEEEPELLTFRVSSLGEGSWWVTPIGPEAGSRREYEAKSKGYCACFFKESGEWRSGEDEESLTSACCDGKAACLFRISVEEPTWRPFSQYGRCPDCDRLVVAPVRMDGFHLMRCFCMGAVVQSCTCAGGEADRDGEHVHSPWDGEVIEIEHGRVVGGDVKGRVGAVAVTREQRCSEAGKDSKT